MSLAAQALEEITDPGLFEELATAVLRRTIPEARGLIHVGLNAYGRTIRSPIDGIAPEGERSGYLLVGHTTTAARDLRKKWLDSDEGDVAKALSIVRAERERDPDTPFTLALTTNRVPDEHLVRDVRAAVTGEGVPVVFLERSRLADYLDNDPDGQWLAAKYLGITQRRLSIDLLRQISAKSAAEFAASVLDAPDCWVDRALDTELGSTLQSRAATFLTMPPGAGKTVAAVRMLTDWVERGGVGLWVPDAVLDTAVTFEQAIDIALRMHVPSLEAHSGSIALDLCDEQAPLLVVVDDITRTRSPVATLERLAAWIANSTTTSSFRLVCPVWPQVVEAIREAPRLWVQARSIAALTSAAAECATAVQRRASQAGSPISRLEAESIASRLGDDLLLVALRSAAGPTTPASKIVAEFAEHCLMASAASGMRFLFADYQAALDHLAFEMLTRRVLEPTWDEILEWLAGAPQHVECIREVVLGRKLCHLYGPPDHQQLAFRHDRVRAALLASSLRRRLDTNELPEEIVSEPYYAEFLGVALATVHNIDEAIDILQVRNPLALVHALVAVDASNEELLDAIVSAILDWLKQPRTQTRANESLFFQMHLALAALDSPVVLRVASGFTSPSWALDIAKLRNGDARGGASVCYSSGPYTNDPRRDELIRHVLAHHRHHILSGVSKLLSSETTSTKLLSGTLFLAGFLGQPDVLDDIRSAWQRRGEVQLIPAFLWAASLCCGPDSEEAIGSIVDALVQVPDTETSTRRSQRSDLLEDAGLRFGFARRLRGSAVRYLVQRAAEPELTNTLISLLERVDDEDAAAFVAEQMASVSRRLEGTQYFSFWLTDDFLDPSGRRRYSPKSRERLLTLWADSSQDRHLRTRAFQLWCADATLDDLNRLRTISPDDVLDDRAVRARIELGDPKVVERFREKLSTGSHPSYWWQFVQRSWRDEYLPDLRAELERRRGMFKPSWTQDFQTDHTIAALFGNLAPNVATELFSDHWDHLRFSSYFVQAALFVATDACARLVSETVADSPEPQTLFRFLSMHWRTGGREERNRLTARRVAGLEPYLDLLNESDVHSLWEGCNTDGFIDWRQRHLDSRLSEMWRKRAGLDESALRDDLDRIASGPGRPWPYHWLEEFERRGEPTARALAAASAWFRDLHSLRAFEVLAECVAQVGRRKDLALLDINSVPETEAAELLYQDARFTLLNRTLV
jgi:hypothetical protein